MVKLPWPVQNEWWSYTLWHKKKPIEHPVTTSHHRDLVYISLSFSNLIAKKTEWEMWGFQFQEEVAEEGAEWA